MSLYAIYDATGYIARVMDTLDVADIALNLKAGENYILLADSDDPYATYVDVSGTPTVTPCPAVPEIPTTLNVNDSIDMMSILSGSTVEYSDVTSPTAPTPFMTIDHTTELLTFDEAGSYIIKVTQPFPGQSATYRVTVS